MGPVTPAVICDVQLVGLTIHLMLIVGNSICKGVLTSLMLWTVYLHLLLVIAWGCKVDADVGTMSIGMMWISSVLKLMDLIRLMYLVAWPILFTGAYLVPLCVVMS